MDPPKVSRKRKAISGPKGIGGKKSRHTDTKYDIENNTSLGSKELPSDQKANVGIVSEVQTRKKVGKFRKHSRKKPKSATSERPNASDSSSLQRSQINDAVKHDPDRSKRSLNKNTVMPTAGESQIPSQVVLHSKNVRFLKSPSLPNKCPESKQKPLNNKKHKKVSSSESNAKDEVPSNAKPSKKRKLLSDNANFKDHYPTHFTSDSDDDDDELVHVDRSVQRERRRVLSERLSRTVFVGNLPSTVSRKHLKQLFNRALRADEQCAAEGCSVESVRFRGVIPSSGGTGKMARKRAVVQGEHSAGVSQTLLAYVVLSSKVGVPVALSLNGLVLDDTARPHLSSSETTAENEQTDPNIAPSGRAIRVDAALQRMSTIKPQNCVFIGNLAFDVQEDEFADVAAVSLAIRATQSLSIRDRLVRVEECKPTGPEAKQAKRWKPKVKVTTPKVGRVRPVKSSVTPVPTSKVHLRLDQTGKVRGITLPSNLRGSMRERYLAKRLVKKQKRKLHRQKVFEQQAQATAMVGEIKAQKKPHKKASKLKIKGSKKTVSTKKKQKKKTQ
ncbi:unnamed protein product [Echinostoma caproni]|uniref:RRM domain-containing protein n=1 Tax=Echinostoma caproni TaxID=27848 RepID=A0A183AYQ4_9TREM|nr:unnamed protein product [Echinostoma caproni]